MRVCLLLVLTVLLALAGCSSGPVKGEVQGKVTFKDQPVKEGTVTFLNTKGGGDAEAEIQPDGTYRVQSGVVVGEYDVEIKPHMEMKDTDPGKTPPSKVEKNAPDIPRKYRQQGSTPFKGKVVKAGKNEINFPMTP